MAPEIILSKGYNKSVDWWSFGVLLFEMSAGFSPFYANSPMKIYEKIAGCRYRFPAFFLEDLRDLIKNLLQVELSRRYGNLRAGVADIKRHKYFGRIDWMRIYNRSVQPGFVPACSGPGDVSNFDRYDEEELRVSLSDKYAKEFDNF